MVAIFLYVYGSFLMISCSLPGKCMTVGAQVMMQSPQENPGGLSYTIASSITNVFKEMLLKRIEPFMHVLDASITYLIGVVHSLGVLIMSQSMAKCNPPDFYLNDIINCACDDQRLSIPQVRKDESIAESAFWCSGVLSMTDSNNNPYYVYNPYSYSDIQALSNGLQDYVDCVSGGSNGYQCTVPSNKFFSEQGVSILNILVKCRENYMNNRWDPSAYMLFDRNQHHLLKLSTLIPVPLVDACGVSLCMSGDSNSGSLVAGCLEEYLLCKGLSEAAYWAYERASDPSPEYTDGCLAFSGPAMKGFTQFQQCVDGPHMGNCSIPAHCWSPSSPNSVPVCESHRLLSHGINRDGLVQRLYSEANAKVMQAVTAALQAASPVNIEFFSVEGDVLHQTMDCIFMGPYTRMDYWPMPYCQAGEECLTGPYWSRDDTGGSTRGVDASTCSTSSHLPYTCGSPARKAIMRYLVQDFLPSRGGHGNTNSSIIREILNLTLMEIRKDWENIQGYGCLCLDWTRSPLCCNLTSQLLPASLNKNFTTLQADTVLQALEDDFGVMYTKAIQDFTVWQEYLDPKERAKYDWTQSRRAEDEARFHPVHPVRSYTKGEAMTPVMDKDSSLWDICHASLKQIFFTLPHDDAGVFFDILAYDGNASRLEEYVKAFTEQAFWKSPLYRHYSPRHTPSFSQMCRQSEPVLSPEGKMGYDTTVQAGHVMMDGTSLPSWPVFDYRRFGIGYTSCLCGWYYNQTGTCLVPTVDDTCQKVCSLVGCVSCMYNKNQEAVLLDNFDSSWYCPEALISAHWGVQDPASTEAWLSNATNLMTSSRDLLKYGRAGLRIGSLSTIQSAASPGINPTQREVPVDFGVLSGCDNVTQTGWSDDLTQEFLDTLFPAAHGVEDSGAIVYCLRYVIEIARLQVLSMTLLEGSREYVKQRESTSLWGRRCGSQLQVIHMCVNLDVFHPKAVTSVSGRNCPHFQPIQSNVAYSTPECLLNVGGVFYDPCRCISCTGDSSLVIDVATITKKHCALRFDPRTIVNTQAPIGWWSQGMPDLTLLLSDSFRKLILEDSDATGNVNDGGNWWDSEGYMADTRTFCDMVLDWWPDDWIYPVGYHVTVPCDANDTAYRSFMQAFAVDESQGGDPVLVYEHDLLRDSMLVDTHFGIGGLCRTVNFGMPMMGTNTMRYCTSVPLNGTEDFTIPVSGGPDTSTYSGGWSDMKCSTKSEDVPWPDFSYHTGRYDSALYSVGTVPNMPDIDSTTYPASGDDMWNIGPWQEIMLGNTWHRCSDYELFLCTEDKPCPTGYICRGRICSDSTGTSCTSNAACGGGTCQGVCLDNSTTQCIMHADCPSGLMCSGIGTCVTPVIAVQNQLLNDNISFQLSTRGNCGSSMKNFSLLGGSYWAYMSRDLLHAHGMCSFENWFKYTQVTTKTPCSVRNNDRFDLDPTKCPLINLESSTPNQSMWWQQGQSRPDMLYMRPTNCDRDYERLEGFMQCSPTPDSAYIITGRSQSHDLIFDQYIKMNTNGTTIPLAVMPFLNDSRFGFLGVGTTFDTIGDLEGAGAHPFVSCSTLGQCYASPFFVNGVKTNRTVAALYGGRKTYPPNNVFKCGAFGIDQGSYCQLDDDVLPLYTYMCNPNFIIRECTSLVKDINRYCLNIKYTYQASNVDRISNLNGLRQLFYIFPSFSDVNGYLSLTTCMDKMFSAIQAKSTGNPGKVSSGLYFPFMFVLYEFPFDWFFQCIIMNEYQVDVTRRESQDCIAYQNKNLYQIENYQSVSTSGMDDALTYLRFVRGGYMATDLDLFDQYNRNFTNKEVDRARGVVQKNLFNDNVDRSYPQCSKNMIWQIGDYGEALDLMHPYIPSLRALIWNWYDTTTCESDWQIDMIKALPSSLGITSDNWKAQVTTPDPRNLVPQDPSVTSLLDIISNFMKKSAGIHVIPSIPSMDQRQGCLIFETILPGSYDYGSNPFDSRLQPTPQTSGYVVVSINDDTVNHTCVFKPPDDPAFAKLYRDNVNIDCFNVPIESTTSKKDTVIRCNGMQCSTVPLAWLREGMFNCRLVLYG